MFYNRATLVTSIVGLLIAGTALALQLHSHGIGKRYVLPRESKFYCQLREFQKVDSLFQKEKIFTIILEVGDRQRPILKMVKAMGDGWNTGKRCGEIETRLNLLVRNGIIAVYYRADPNTPKQFVLCAQTENSGNDCPLLVTLLPEDDPKLELQEVVISFKGSGPPATSIYHNEPRDAMMYTPLFQD